MTFVSTSITPAGKGKYRMTGNLTLRGVTKPVTLDLDQPAGVHDAARAGGHAVG